MRSVSPLVEAANLAVDRAGGDTGLLRALDRSHAEHHDGPGQLVAGLLRPLALELELLPIISGLEQCSLPAGHPQSPIHRSQPVRTPPRTS